MFLLRVMWFSVWKKVKVEIRSNASGTVVRVLFGKRNRIMEVGRHIEDAIAIIAFPSLARGECVGMSFLKKW